MLIPYLQNPVENNINAGYPLCMTCFIFSRIKGAENRSWPCILRGFAKRILWRTEEKWGKNITHYSLEQIKILSLKGASIAAMTNYDIMQEKVL